MAGENEGQQNNASGSASEQHNLNTAPQHAVVGNEAQNAGGSSNFIRPPKPLVVSGENSANNWKLWIQQYEWFEEATNMHLKTQKMQVATFMSTIGTEAVIIFNTFGCTDIELASIVLIKQRFNQYFTPKIKVTFERYQLNRMKQEEGEPFDEFLTRLKAQSAKCGFGELHDSLLCDRIIIGISSEVLREQLLGDEQEPTLDRLAQRCRASELASKQLRGLKEDPATVNAIRKYKNKQDRSSKSFETFDCKRCGSTHGPKSCPAFKEKCNNCDREGHLTKMCRSGTKTKKSKKQKQPKKVNAIEEASSDDDDFFISTISKERAETNRDNDSHWLEQIQIRDVSVRVKLDSGAECNVISKAIADRIGGTKSTRTKRLISYTGDKINVAGEIIAPTKVRGKVFNIKYIVIEESREPVLGLKTCEATGLIKRIDAVKLDQPVFTGLGCLKNFEYDIDFIENPKFEIHAARKIPHAYRQAVKDELDQMVKQNVIREATEATPAVSPMVIVKQKGQIRICIDPTDVNKNVIRRHYPLKTLEEIAAKISGSKIFSKLDCKKGFWQIKLSERTQKFLTFATPWGRYSCVKLPFGLCSAPEVFQQIMSKLLTDINKAEASMDDILIYANDKAELDKTTAEVIKRIEDAGLTLNKDKCEFAVDKIRFLGHILSARGVEIDQEKVDAIDKLREPSNKVELQRLLGMVTYLAKFIPNLSEITQPLRKLLEKESDWVWTPHQAKAVEQIKKALSSTPVLRFYNVNEDVKLQADASSYALGAALFQADQPVAYASRSLTKAELNYPQIEKEALAIRFACKKYHEYIYGKKLTVETDHKPLETIFKKPISNAPPRLQRILLEIAPYAPTVIYRKGETMYVADTLSRDCDPNEATADEEFEVLAILSISNDAMDRLRIATKHDEELTIVRQYVQGGWPTEQQAVQAQAKSYWNFRDEISEFNGLMFKGQKIIIPAKEKSTTLNQLHSGHQGVQRTLAIARDHVFWLNMSKDITDFIKKCRICETTQRSNTKEPMIVKVIPIYPFQIIASDLFKYQVNDYLLIADSYSGFFDFKKLNHTTSKEIIEHLKSWFAIHGIPAKLETDNGPQYASREFKQFAQVWGFEHVTSSPKYPQSNGLAERSVQTAKNILRKCALDNTDINLAMLTQRNTPRSKALGSPSQRLMSRTTRSLIPTNEKKLQPQVIDDVSEQLKMLRNKQKQYYDRNTKPAKELSVGEKVRLQQNAYQWTGATITEATNKPRSFIVETDDGRKYRRNTSHLHPTQANFKRIPEVTTNINASPEQFVEQHQQQHKPANPNIQLNEIDPPAPTSHQYVTRYGRVVKPVTKMNL